MRGLRPWAVTAAAIAAVVCFAGWPVLTGYAIGTAVAVASLWFGVRALIREQHQRRAVHEPKQHCEVVELGAGVGRITSDRPLTARELAAAEQVIAAARRRYAAEHREADGQGEGSSR